MATFDPRRLPDQPPEPAFHPWTFRPEVAQIARRTRLPGCRVEAVDGRVGTVVDASLTPDNSYLVVVLSRWPFGKRTQLPAGTVNHIDAEARRVYVDRSAQIVKAAPLVLPEAYDDPASRAAIAEYYRSTYRAHLNQ